MKTILSLLFAALAGCAPDAPTAEAAAPLRVASSFYPLTYFAEEIAGARIELITPVPPEADPAFWKPERDALLALHGVDLILVNGADFEKWVAKVSLPESRVVYTAQGFRADWIEGDEETHSHGGLTPHSHGRINGHTWVDPLLALRQAAAVLEALAERRPAQRTEFEAGFEALQAKLSELDHAWKSLGPNLQKASVLASHPSYDYAARRYGFDIANFDLDPAAALTEAELELIRQAAGSGAPKLMLWESEPLAGNRSALLGHGIVSVVFEPGEVLDEARRSRGRNFHTIMLDNLKRLAKALTP